MKKEDILKRIRDVMQKPPDEKKKVIEDLKTIFSNPAEISILIEGIEQGDEEKALKWFDGKLDDDKKS